MDILITDMIEYMQCQDWAELEQLAMLVCSFAVIAEISLKSPRKIFIFIIKKYIDQIKVSKNK